MHLRSGEVLLKKTKRHKTPFVFKILKILAVASPIYIILLFMARDIDAEWILLAFAATSFFVGIVIAIVAVEYLFDRLIITNERIVHIDWHSVFRKEEHTAELKDVQDVQINVKGLLSKIGFFNYGMIEVETASAKICVTFHDCPNPEGIKNLIFRQLTHIKQSEYAIIHPHD